MFRPLTIRRMKDPEVRSLMRVVNSVEAGIKPLVAYITFRQKRQKENRAVARLEKEPPVAVAAISVSPQELVAQAEEKELFG